MLALIVLISGCVEEKAEKEQAELNESEMEEKQEQQQIQIKDEEILKIAKQKDEVRKFITENHDYDYEITILTPENITQLAGKYPVMYGGLPSRTLYRVDYKSGNYGIVVIVDVENKKVLKYFRTTGINI